MTKYTICKMLLAALLPVAIRGSCPDGQYDVESVCTECPANSYCQGGVLTACPLGATSPAGSSAFSACLCPASNILNGTYNCRPCETGYACASQTSEVLCVAGQFAPQPTPTECVTCTNNSYSVADASTSCTACPGNATAADGSVSILQCTCINGFYRDAEYQCVPCPAGSRCSNNVRTTCLAGTFSHAMASACTNCELGTYQSATGTSGCLTCPAGKEVLQISSGTEFNAPISREHTSVAANKVYIMRNFFISSQGNNLTTWSFYASKASCTVTPAIFRADVNGNNLDGNVWFTLHQLGTTRTTTSVGAHTFDFLDGSKYSVRAAVPTGVPYVNSYEFFGWIFTGDVCIPYDLGDPVTTFFFVMPFDYDAQATSYFKEGNVYDQSAYWSVQVTYEWGNTVPATNAVASTSIFDCKCPTGARQLSDGNCQGLCQEGTYMLHETDDSCTTCPQGSYCRSSVRYPCASGYSSLPGAGTCSLCPGPGTHTNIALNLCGLLQCADATPARLGSSDWFGLGNITKAAGGEGLAPSTGWYPGAEVLGLILNAASDRPVAVLQRGIDVTPGTPIAFQFRYVCTGASCNAAFEVQWSKNATYYETIFSSETVPSTDWVQTSTQYIIPTAARITLRFHVKMVPSSAIVWLATVETVSLGQWTHVNIDKLRLLETTTVLIPHSDIYSEPVESSTIRITDTSLAYAVPTGVIYPGGYPYLATVWAKGEGTLSLQTSGAMLMQWTVSDANAWTQLNYTTTDISTQFTLTTTGSVIIASPSLTLRSKTIGCQSCLSDYWCASQQIFECPSHAQSAAGSYRQADCYCLPGYYGNVNSQLGWTPCAPCDENYYCTGGNHIAVCPNGTKAAIGSSACVACEVDQYCALGQVGICPAHSYSPTNSDDITDCTCADGYYGVSPNCQACEPGYYCTGGARIACTAHATSTPKAPAATSCYCDRGYYGIENAACTACEEASWCWTGIKNSCPANMWSPTLSSYAGNCTCEYGYKRASVSSCTPCGTGTFKPTRGEDLCTECPVGYFSQATGATSSATCARCDVGTFAAVPGQYQCEDCAAGYYTSTLGSTTCQTCWPGSYSHAGYAACSLCSAGTMSGVTAATSSAVCTACPVGSWSQGNSSFCNICGACPYWSYPRSIFFYSLTLSTVMANNTVNVHLARYGNKVVMSQFRSLMYVDLTTGDVQPLTIEAPGVGGVYSSIAPSALGNYIYLAQGAYVYRVDMDMLSWDTVYTSSLASCVFEDGLVIWIVQPDTIRSLDPVSTSVQKTFAVAGSAYACIHEAHPDYLFTVGSYGLKRVHKVTGEQTLLNSAAAYVQCAFSTDGEFIFVSTSTGRQAWAYSLFDGRMTRILNNAIVTSIFDDNGTVVFAVQNSGVRNVTYISKDSATCSVGKFSLYSGLQLESQCELCPAGSLCPGGANITLCSPGTYSLATGNREQAQCHSCPRGYYCTGGDGIHVCPLGTYSLSQSVTNVGDCPLCTAGYFCPNTTTQVQCPENTHSLPGSSDLGECTCVAGYRCLMVKVVHCEVVLPIAASAFTAEMQAAYIQAIALAAGVDPSSVHIIAVQQVTLGGGRRLLEHGHVAVEVHTSIYKARSDALNDLNHHLESLGLPSHRGIRISIHKEVVSSIRL